MERFQYVISLRIPPSNNPRFESGGSFSMVIGRFDFPIHLQLGEKINIRGCLKMWVYLGKAVKG
jgi:hypothetical protein